MWEILGIEPTTDEGAIRKAYARELKLHRPDKDPQGYQQLREAFDEARRYAAYHAEEETLHEVSVTFSYVPETDVAQPFREPEGLQPDAVLNEPLWNYDGLRHDAYAHAQALMENEVVALKAIERYLDHELPDALEARRIYSVALAEALSEQPGLGRSLVNNVSALMNWELDSIHTPQLPAWIIDALEAQIDTTFAEHYWQTLALQGQEGRYAQLKWRLLSGNDEALPWWTRLVPDLLMTLKNEVIALRWRYPQLLDRVNPALVNAAFGQTWALSWTLLIGLWFWGYSAWIAGQESLTMAAQSLLLVVVIAFYLCVYPRLVERADDGGKMAKFALAGLWPLAWAIIAVPIWHLLSLAHHVQPIEKGPARVCMAIAILAYPLYWTMKVQGHNWLVRPGNVVRNVFMLPIRLIREQNMVVKFFGLFFTPILMALLIQMAYYVE